MLKSEYPSVRDVTMSKVWPADVTSEKGSKTWDVLHVAGSDRTVVPVRDPGDLVGNHFHPAVRGKNPEKFIVFRGLISFWFEDVHGGYLPMYIDTEFHGVVEVTIPPYILHGVDVVRQVWFIESGVGPYDPANTRSEEEFKALVTSLKE